MKSHIYSYLTKCIFNKEHRSQTSRLSCRRMSDVIKNINRIHKDTTANDDDSSTSIADRISTTAGVTTSTALNKEPVRTTMLAAIEPTRDAMMSTAKETSTNLDTTVKATTEGITEAISSEDSTPPVDEEGLIEASGLKSPRRRAPTARWRARGERNRQSTPKKDEKEKGNRITEPFVWDYDFPENKLN